MKPGTFGAGMARAGRSVRWGRLAVILLVALAAGLACDWLRADRVLWPAPLPEFTMAPAR